jgi:hypothetical protein
MKYLEKPSHTCDICGKHRTHADHTQCSKKRQEMHQKDKRHKNHKKLTPNSEAYFADMLKRLGE